MNYYDARKLLLLLATAFVSSCIQKEHGVKEQLSQAEIKEKLIRANRQFVKNQLDDIHGYIDRHGYKMDSTQTGLHYQIKKTDQRNALAAGPDDVAGIRYTIKLLDGRDCYTADSTLYREYHLSNDDMPAGLREGLLMMNQGDKALLIIPSYLAFGLSGDSDCIPPNAALVMTVTLEKLIKNNK